MSARPVAGLPMYDWPELRAATDALWRDVAARLAARGIEAPTTLARSLGEAALWRHPGLVLAQTCGLPLVTGRCGAARLVGRPDYGLPLAAGGRYVSVIVTRRGEGRGRGPGAVRALAGARLAVNDWGSFSGHVALRAHLAALGLGARAPFFGRATVSGSHRASARMVARGEADVAALDSVAWALLGDHDPGVAEVLEVIALTAPAPALPFITGPAHAGREGVIRGALGEALTGALGNGRRLPGLPRRVIPAEPADYEPVRRALGAAARAALAPDAPDLTGADVQPVPRGGSDNACVIGSAWPSCGPSRMKGVTGVREG